MGQTLPLPTIVLIRVSNAFASYWWVVLAAVGAAVLMVRGYSNTAEGRAYIDGLKLKLPVLRKLA